MKEYIISLLSNKPYIGIAASFSGTGASILGACKVISIVAGALGAIIGCTVGVITLLIKIREWRQGRRKV